MQMRRKGYYYDKSAGHFRVRINQNRKQINIGTTLDEYVACAMRDLYLYLNGLEKTYLLNMPECTMYELFNFIGERDPRALKNLMKNSKVGLTGNDVWSDWGVS